MSNVTLYEQFSKITRDKLSANISIDEYFDELRALGISDEDYEVFSERFMTALLTNIDNL